MASYIRVSKNGGIEYPFNLFTIRAENPKTSFPSTLSDSLLSKYGVYPVALVASPSATIYEKAVEGMPALINGTWHQTWNIVPANVPDSITPRQCRLLLHQKGMLSQAEAAVASSTDDVKITWEYALEFRRSDPLLNQLATSLNLTQAQIDQFFIEAAKI